jgi:uncharacterized protein YjdB
VPVGSVVVAPGSVSITAGQTAALAVTLKDANGLTLPLTGRVVAWSSSNLPVATVSATGVVTAVSPGAATITATSEGKLASTTVTVSRVPVGTVAVAPVGTLRVGQTATLSATVKDANGSLVTDRAVVWSSDNFAIASVSQNGVVTAVSVGTATITATSEGKSGNTVVTITPVPVGSVAVSSIAGPLRVGQTATLAATVKNTDGVPVTDRVVTWASSNQAVATVSSAGLVTAVGPGSATITATSEGQSGSTEVVVLAPVASVALQPASVTLELGGTRTLTATMTSADGSVLTGRSVTYESDNNGIVSVSSTGAVAALVTGVGYGTATITATSEGKTATTKVVVQPTVAFVFMSPIIQVVTRGTTVQLSAIALDASNHQVFGRDVVWTSSDTAVATVSADGLLTTRKTGTVTITATIDGVSGSEKITVAKPKDDDSSSGDPGDE